MYIHTESTESINYAASWVANDNNNIDIFILLISGNLTGGNISTFLHCVEYLRAGGRAVI